MVGYMLKTKFKLNIYDRIRIKSSFNLELLPAEGR